jgi:hypothetical protein
MSVKMKLAFGCHLVAILIVAAFGVTYLFRTEFMPYHAVALGTAWSALNASTQVLILALMKAVGGACLAVVAYGLFVLLVPFRQGALWALWALPVGGLLIASGALYAMALVALNTPANPPWIAPAIGALLVLIALALSLADRRRTLVD